MIKKTSVKFHQKLVINSGFKNSEYGIRLTVMLPTKKYLKVMIQRPRRITAQENQSLYQLISRHFPTQSKET